MTPFIPPPPRCTARPDHDAGNATRKLIGFALFRRSIGAMVPSTAQYGGTGPAASVQRGSFKVTLDTGSLIAAIGTELPITDLEQSVCASVL